MGILKVRPSDMSGRATLHAYNRLVNSPFGLLGTDENALSFALAYTLQQCPRLLQWFLKQVGIRGVSRASLRTVCIDVQKHGSGSANAGITDIEIHLPGRFHVIVEAKIGLAVPTSSQCKRYIRRFRKTGEPVQKLVALVQSPDESFVPDYCDYDHELSQRLVLFNWSKFIPRCVDLMLREAIPDHERQWARNFHDFLDQEFPMKAFTTEVWIVSASTEPLWRNGMSHWDIHQKYRLWWDYREPAVRPLYFAFRANGKLDAIWRVRKIEHGIPIVDRVPPIKKNIKRGYTAPATIWHLEERVPLIRELTTGWGMFNRRVRCHLDLLLKCNTVQQIEVEMGKRREKSVN